MPDSDSLELRMLTVHDDGWDAATARDCGATLSARNPRSGVAGPGEAVKRLRRRTALLCALASLAVGCGPTAEQCNASRVSAYDAWGAYAAAIEDEKMVAHALLNVWIADGLRESVAACKLIWDDFLAHVDQGEHRDYWLAVMFASHRTHRGINESSTCVETEDQLAMLRELGVHEGQGYLLSRPMCADQVNDLFAAAESASDQADSGPRA